MGIIIKNKLKSNNPTEFGVVDAVDISGFRQVSTFDALYNLRDCILSSSGNNTDNDAIGQIWHVAEGDGDYRLIDWENRFNENGWKKVSYDGSGGGDIDNATDKKDGLMSKEDKQKLDGLIEMTESEVNELTESEVNKLTT